MIEIVTRLIECAKRAMPNDSGKEHGLAGLCLEAARELENARREAASWEQQASDRTDDAVRFAQERDALKAKIEAMEKQEPTHWSCKVLQADASWKEEVGREIPPDGYYCIRDIKPLYALPGAQAQPAPSVLADLTPLESVQYWADAYGNPMGDEHFLGHGVAARLLREYVNLRAMLAAAPEAKL